MKKLHLFVIKTFLGPLIATFFVVVFILLMQFLWKYIDDLIGKGLELNTITELLLYASAGLVPLAIPLAVLLASLMTFGSMGENLELTALKSSGISLQRIMAPLLLLTTFISIGAFLFSNNVLPYTNLKFRSLLYDIQQQRPEMQIREGVFYHGIDNYSIKVADKDYSNNMMYDVKIYDHTDRRGNLKVTVADSGFMRITEDKRFLITTLYNGYNHTDIDERGVHSGARTFPNRTDRFDEQVLVIEMDGFDLERTDEDAFRHNSQMMNINQLRLTTDSLTVVFAERVREHTDNMIMPNFYQRENYLINRDTVLRIDRKAADIWSMEEGLTHEEKRRALEQSLVEARHVKNQILSTNTNFNYQNRRIRMYDMEWHRKFTLSFACVIFFFIGAPLGAIIRKGGLGMPVVISVLFFVIYYIIDISAQKFVKELRVTPFPGMWISSFILLPVGIFLTYKATTDSPVMNTETYYLFFNKYYNLLSNKIDKLLGVRGDSNQVDNI